MRLGVVDAVLPPFTRAKLKFLLRYVLKPTDLRWLQEQSKKLHAQQQSGLGGIGGGEGGGGAAAAKGGKGGGGGAAASAGGGGAAAKSPGGGGGGILRKPTQSLSASSTAGVARIDAAKSAGHPRGRAVRSVKLLDMGICLAHTETRASLAALLHAL